MEVVFGCVGIPLSVELIVVVFGFEPYPSIERLILCGLVPCLLCRGCSCLREELCTLKVVLPKSSVEVPCVGSPVLTH